MQRLEVRGAVRPIYGSLGVKRLTTSWLISTPVELPLPMKWYSNNLSTVHIQCTIRPVRNSESLSCSITKPNTVTSCVVFDTDEDKMETIKMVVVVTNWMHISSCNPFLSLPVHWLFQCPVLHFTSSILAPFLSYDLFTWGYSISYAFILCSLDFL